MPGEEGKSGVTTEKIENIPLYLIPKTIADQIRKKGKAVFQIMVEKTFHNSFTIIVGTGDNYALQDDQEAPARTDGDGHG
ncbi:MAG: hypothetical protein Q7V05_06145 [Methanoregula sp.]|nr:hypothetical protein [Methanoregula sp.]